MTTRKIKALGEIALRVNDLDAMQTFYQDVIGLELMRRFPDSAFFKIADGYGGHTQILALFDRSSQSGYTGLSAAQKTAAPLPSPTAREDFEPEPARLEALGCKLTFANHDWVHWRSLYV